MVLVNQVKEPLQKMVALFLRHTIDVPHMAPYGEDTLPPSHRIGADDWVDRLEIESDVLRRATGLTVELKPTFLSDLLEVWLGKRPGQSLQELLVRLADAVVDLVARGPECVWSASASEAYYQWVTSHGQTRHGNTHRHLSRGAPPSAVRYNQLALARRQCRSATGRCTASWR